MHKINELFFGVSKNSYQKKLKLVSIIFLIIFSVVLLINSINRNSPQTLNVINNGGMKNISIKLNREFKNYQNDNENIKRNYQNPEELLLENILLENGLIKINQDNLKSKGFQDSLLEIIKDKEFHNEIIESIENNRIIILENRLIFNEGFMNSTNYKFSISQRANSDYWAKSKWYWFGYWRLEMNNNGRRALLEMGYAIIFELAEKLLSSALEVNKLEEILISMGYVTAAAIATSIWWFLLTIGSIMLLNIATYMFVLNSFSNYDVGSYIGVYILVITNWGRN